MRRRRQAGSGPLLLGPLPHGLWLAPWAAAVCVGHAAAQPAAHSHAAAPRSYSEVTDPRQADPAQMASRTALLRTGEQALARGDTEGAIVAFDRAAMMLHSADTEMGLVRAYMQSGDYRRALAFCAHTAGGHGDAPAAAALYAWLLRAGGQDAVATRVLAEAQASAPGDAVVAATVRAFGPAANGSTGVVPSPSTATGVMLELPHRMAPLGVPAPGQAPPSAQARVVSSGVSMSPALALAPASTLQGARRWWVRDGLGRTSEATVEPASDELRALGLVRLRLLAPLNPAPTGNSATSRDPASIALSGRDPYAGRPGYAVEYVVDDSGQAPAEPAWPRLRPGFFGGYKGNAGWRRLGIDVPVGAHGGPVFDAAGRLAGIAMAGALGQASMIPASLLKTAWPEAPPGAAPTAATASAQPLTTEHTTPMPADEVFELGLRHTLQIIVEPGPPR